MRFADKDLNYYTEIMIVPFIILVCWDLAGLVVSMADPKLLFSGPFKYAGWILPAAVYGYTGWIARRRHEAKLGQGVWAGTLCGVAAGFAGGIIGIMTFFVAPDLVDAAMTQIPPARAGQISREFMEKMMMIMTFVGLVTGPLLSGAFGALGSLVGALIAGESKKRPPNAEESADKTDLSG